MIRIRAWAVILLMFAVAASPAAAYGVPAGSAMMPMHGGSGQNEGQSAGCNCQASQQASASAPRTAPLPRTAGGPASSPCSGSADPFFPGTSSTTGRVSGIRRIYPKNVLDHPERAAVYTAIVTRPGIDLAGIASELGLNRETLRYHLDQLDACGRVIVLRDRGIVRYFENHGRYSPLERQILAHSRNPTAGAVLSLIDTEPGITRAGIAGRLAVTPPTVRWYLQRFMHDGIVTPRCQGRQTGWYLTNEAARVVRGGTGDTGAGDVPDAARIAPCPRNIPVSLLSHRKTE